MISKILFTTFPRKYRVVVPELGEESSLVKLSPITQDAAGFAVRMLTRKGGRFCFLRLVASGYRCPA